MTAPLGLVGNCDLLCEYGGMTAGPQGWEDVLPTGL
jgi:hypothetical protein